MLGERRGDIGLAVRRKGVCIGNGKVKREGGKGEVGQGEEGGKQQAEGVRKV